MESNTALTVRQPGITEMQLMGKSFYESGMFPDVKSAAQALVKIQAGAEIGLPPIYSMTKIYIVKGRVMVGSEVLGALVKRSGRYDYRVVKLDDAECELMFTDNGKDAYLSKFTMEDAKRADLVQPNSGWQKWPRAMLVSKAVSQGARIVCPHLIGGAYVPEDFGGYTDQDTGKVVIQEPNPPAVSEKPPMINQQASEAKEVPTTIEKDDDLFTEPGNEKPEPKYKRDPESVKTLSMLINSCFADFHLQPNEIYKELGVTSVKEITAKPADCYRQIAAVRS